MVQPSATEQYMLELINRARLNPTAEGTLHGVSDLNDELASGTISTDPKQPLAFNLLLIDSARSHSQWMLDTDTFSHTGINGTSSRQRMGNAGYQFTGPAWGSGENIAYKGTTGGVNKTAFIESSHASLFKSPGHRKNILKDNYREIGVGAIEGIFTSEVENPNYDPVNFPEEPEFIDVDFNSLMVTQNFAYSGSDVFLTGVAYDDLVLKDDFYTVGEGLSGIEITAVNTSTGNSHSINTMDAGGYQIPLTSDTYNLTFTDTDNNILGSTQVNIGTENIKLDLNLDGVLSLFFAGSSDSERFKGISGNDTLYGNNGNDTLSGSSGADFLSGGANPDLLNGGEGDDTLDGGSGNDKLYGKEGHDSLLGGSGNDYFSGHDGNDTAYGGDGNDTLAGGSNNDKLYGEQGDDFLVGNNGKDTLSGSSGTDFLSGGANHDLLNGGEGDDTLDGGSGNDKLHGKEGHDSLLGGLGNDYFSGHDGNDTMYGGDGKDTLAGGNHDDLLYGDEGDDLLWGGDGNDTMFGGAGTDIFALESTKDTILVDDFISGVDLIGLTGSLNYSDLNFADSGLDVLIYDSTNNNALLAKINNINAADFTQADFVTV